METFLQLGLGTRGESLLAIAGIRARLVHLQSLEFRDSWNREFLEAQIEEYTKLMNDIEGYLRGTDATLQKRRDVALGNMLPGYFRSTPTGDNLLAASA